MRRIWIVKLKNCQRVGRVPTFIGLFSAVTVSVARLPPPWSSAASEAPAATANKAAHVSK